jgi:hypothetical protein
MKTGVDMKVNPITGEVDLRLLPEETAYARNRTLSELRAEIPAIVERELRKHLAARQRVIAHREQAAAIHAHSGDHLALRL